MDADGDGRLSWGDMKLLYDAVQRSCSGGILLHFEDLMNQIRDMVSRQRHPAKGFSAQEMWDSKLGAGVIGLLTNANNMLLQRSTAEWGRGESADGWPLCRAQRLYTHNTHCHCLGPCTTTAFNATHAVVFRCCCCWLQATSPCKYTLAAPAGARRSRGEKTPCCCCHGHPAAFSRLPADPIRCCSRQPGARQLWVHLFPAKSRSDAPGEFERTSTPGCLTWCWLCGALQDCFESSCGLVDSKVAWHQHTSIGSGPFLRHGLCIVDPRLVWEACVVDARLTHVQLSNLLGDGSLKPSNPLARTVGVWPMPCTAGSRPRLCVCARVCVYVCAITCCSDAAPVRCQGWLDTICVWGGGRFVCLILRLLFDMCTVVPPCVQVTCAEQPMARGACPCSYTLSPHTPLQVCLVLCQSALKLYQGEKGTSEQNLSRCRLVMAATASVLCPCMALRWHSRLLPDNSGSTSGGQALHWAFH